MIVEVAAGLVVASSTLYGVYKYGQTTVEVDGCNGHHWGDFESVKTKSSKTVAKAYDGNGDVDQYDPHVTNGNLEIWENGIKQCEDCREVKSASRWRVCEGVREVIKEMGGDL